METVIRIVIVYIAIVAGLRILGKREFGQLSPVELVTLLLIPEIVAPVLNQENTSLTNGLVGISTLFALVFLTSAVMHLSKRFEAVIAGEPMVLVAHGRMIPKHMNKERVTPDELYNEMHISGLDDLSQVRWAVLESDGKISIVPEDRPATTSGHVREEGRVG